MNFQEFAKQHNITATSTKVDSNPNMLDFKGDHWRVTLLRLVVAYYVEASETYTQMAQTSFTLHFSKGYGHNGAPPEVVEVLECLHSDAHIADNCPTFEDFCSELGYDEDSRKAERTYKALRDQTAEVQAWLGGLYDEFLDCEED